MKKWHLPVLPVKILKSYFEAVCCLAQKSSMESRRHFEKEVARSIYLILSNRLIDNFEIVILG